MTKLPGGRRFPWHFILAGTGLGMLWLTAQAQLLVTPSRTDGIYAVGEPMPFVVTVTNPALVGSISTGSYTYYKNGGSNLGSGSFTFTGGVAYLPGVAMSEPAMVRVNVTSPGISNITGYQGGTTFYGGSSAGPEKMAAVLGEPADFDAFWTSNLTRLAAVPTNAVLTHITNGIATNIDYYQIRMDNITNSHVMAHFAMPKGGTNLPALIILQYAGVYALPPGNVTGYAAEGWLAINVMAHHDVLIDQPQSYYDALTAPGAPYYNYQVQGRTNRETSYFLTMFLGVVRCADYITGRPEWNGKTLMAIGTSMGGQQAFALAGLRPNLVSALAVKVPAGQEHTGPLGFRATPYPYWLNGLSGVDYTNATEASRYYDGPNFAARARAAVLAGPGFIDNTAVPSGILTSMAKLKGAQELSAMLYSDHGGSVPGSTARFDTRSTTWRTAIRQGKNPPVFLNTNTSGTLLWNAAANWQMNTAPVSPDVTTSAFFPGVTLPPGTITVQQNSATTFTNRALSLAGTAPATGSCTVSLIGNALGFMPNGPSEATLDLSANGTNLTYIVGQPVLIASNLTISGSGSANFLFTNTLSGSVGLYKIGDATLTLTGSNSFNGGISLRGGTLAVDHDSSFGAVPVSPTLNLNFGWTSSLRALSSLTLAANRSVGLTNGASATLAAGTGVVLRVDGLITGPGKLVKSDSGTVILANSNAFSGGMTLGTGGSGDSASTGGRLVAAHGFAFAQNTVIINGGSNPGDPAAVPVLALTNNISVANTFSITSARTGSSNSLPHLSSVGSNTLSGVLFLANGGGNGLNVESASGLLTLSGRYTNTVTGSSGRPLNLQGAGDFLISGRLDNGTTCPGVLWMNGTGTATITGSNSFTGGTAVNLGTLIVNGRLGAGGVLFVSSNATLGGTGVVATVTTIAGTHRPGTSPGLQSFAAPVTYAATSHLVWELIGNTTNSPGTQYDRITAPVVTVSNGAVLDVVLNGAGSAVNLTNLFWRQTQTWQFVVAGAVTGTPALGSVTLDSAAQNPATQGAFSVTNTGTALALVWVPTPADATVGVTATTPNASEAGPTNGVFTFTRTGSTNNALTLNYTVGGTASNGADYTSLPGSVFLPAGQTTVTVSVIPVDDGVYDPGETVLLSLAVGAGYDLGAPASDTVTVDDNDPLPGVTATLTAPDAVASERGGNPGQFTLTLSAPSGVPVPVNLTYSGTAAAGTDYTTLPTNVTLAAGQTSTNLIVTALPDASPEGQETVVAQLASGASYIIGSPSNAVVTIEDSPVFTVVATVTNAYEAGPTNGVFTVTRANSSLGTQAVGYAVSGTAAAGSDYTALAGTVAFSNGQTTAVINVTPLAPTSNGTVLLTLATNAAYLVGSPAAATVNVISVESSYGQTNAFISTSSTVWLDAANWSPAEIPPAFNVASFGVSNGFGTSVGIDMAAAGGAQQVGAIVVTSARTNAALILGNSSTIANGTLILNGASVNGVANTVLRNTGSGTTTLTIQNTQGSGNKTNTLSFNTGANPAVIDASSAITLSAVITNATGGIQKSGTGILTLSANHPAANLTLISAGALQVGTGNGSTAGSFGPGTFTNNGWLAFSRVNTNTIPNSMSGSGSFSNSGVGTTILTGTNTYTGNTIAANGVIVAATTQSLAGYTVAGKVRGTNSTSGLTARIGSGPGEWTFGAFETLRSNAVIQVTSAIGFDYTNVSALAYPGYTNSEAYGFAKSGSGQVILTESNNNSGGLLVSGGTLTLQAGRASGAPGAGIVNVDMGTLDFDMGTGGVFVSTGNLRMSQPNGANNQTSVSTLTVRSGDVTFAGGSGANVGDANTGTIATPTVNVWGGSLNFTGSGNIVFGRKGTGGATVNVTNGLLYFGNTNRVVFGGDISSSSSSGFGTLNVSGSGLVVLSNSAQAFQLASTNGARGIINLLPGGVMQSARDLSQMPTAVSGTGTLYFAGGTLRAGTNSADFIRSLTLAAISTNGAIIDTTNYAITINQALLHFAPMGGTPDGGLTKRGNGMLTLGGTNTFTGPTLVSAGTLRVNSTLASSPLTTIANGGVLTGTGAVAAVQVQGGGVLSPGTGVGTLKVNGNAAFGSGAVYAWDYNGSTGDLLTPPTATFTSTWTLAVNATGLLTNGTYTVLTTTGGVTGFVAPVVTGATGTVALVGNNLVLTVAPAAPLSPFEIWQTNYFGSTTNGSSAFDADPDGDGMVNLLEYALNGLPLTAGSPTAPAIGTTNVGPALTLTFSRIDDPALIYSVQASPDLGSAAWTNIWSSTGSTNVAGSVIVTDPEPFSGAPDARRFLRLRVEHD